jgi:AraC-like DNA-binding protein
LRTVQKTLPAPAGAAPPRIDVLSEVLRTVRLTGATFFSAEFRAPWGVTSPPVDTLRPGRPDPGTHLVLYHLVLEGQARARVDGGPEVGLGPGDIVAFPHGHPHRLWQGSTPTWHDTCPAVRRALAGTLEPVRAGGRGEMTRFVCGYFSCEQRAARTFLAGLPALLTVSVRDEGRSAWLEDAIRFLALEAASDHAGRAALLTRLSEALFIDTLRRWMLALPADQVGWLAGARDDVVGRALALLHRHPARRWSLDALAREVGASRSIVASRFAHFVQEAPMAYLTRWRLQLGARLLETTRQPIVDVAAGVGYESEAAFNRAFRREYGLPPGRYRRAAAAGGTAGPRRARR